MKELLLPVDKPRINILTAYRAETKNELNDILGYWMRNTHDAVNGGFIGRIDENNTANPYAPKGAVLNARILWSFSAAFTITQNAEHLYLARTAFNYLTAYFIDPLYGGIFWTITANGQPLDTKKQIYALAFAIYGCSAYYEVSNNEKAKETAIELYRLIETYSFDSTYGGYLEAFDRYWQPIEDLRLSDKDANEKKTMNTHLHVLEAYTGLYRIWPDEKLKTQIERLLRNFTDHIIDGSTGHLKLFFDEHWNHRPAAISYGHEIEAAWLLPEAAAVIGGLPLLEEINKASEKIAAAAAEGLDSDGGLWYEKDIVTNHLIKEKHWWVQAEAMVGFFNRWQQNGDKKDLERSLASWNYISIYIKDKRFGEWLWGLNGDGTAMEAQDKVGIWKCPYHNSRACIEIVKRLQVILSERDQALADTM